MRNLGKLVLLLLVLSSCRSARVDETSVAFMPARAIVKKNEQASFNRESIKASLAIKFKGKDEVPNINASLRMVKDSVIWINFTKLGFPVAKLMITRDEVQFYEKVTKTSFQGDFKLISSWMGTEFDFDKVQNLFLGEPLLDLQEERWQAKIENDKYKLLSKKGNREFEFYLKVDPNHFKISEEGVRHRQKDQNFTILYKNFSKIDQSLFPEGFLITASDAGQLTRIEVNYENVQFDDPMRFPFKMPVGYRNIELE